MIETTLRTLRHAGRRIRRSPVYSATVVLCLALGIGANTAIFSVVNTLLLQPLPVEDVDRLAFVLAMREYDDPFEAALVDYLAVRDHGSSFAGTGVAQRESFTLLDGDRPERIEAAAVSHDYLATLGVEPLRGRGFETSDDRPGAPRVALVGYGLWQRRFGGDPSLLGRTLTLEGEPHTVVGVLPPRFDLPLGTELWVPLALAVETLPVDRLTASNFLMAARLAPDVTLEQANREADALARRISADYPEHRANWGMKLIPLRQQLLGDINGRVGPALHLLLAVVAFLLLIACANVAGLMLVRSLERGHEVAVHTALGASRGRLIGELLTESVLLALLGGLLALGLAWAITPPLLALSPVTAFSLQDLFAEPAFDGRVLGFTLGVSLATGLLFGLAPALRVARRPNLVEHLKDGGGRASGTRADRRWLSTLVVAEIAVAVVLLLAAGLTLQSFRDLQQLDLGFSPGGKLAVELFVSEARYPEPADRLAHVERLLERLRSLPGVERATMTTTLPLAISTWDAPYTVAGRRPAQQSEVPITAHRLVTPGYLESMGIEVVAGRTLTPEDREGAVPVVVVSRELARRAWPGEDALGQQIQVGFPPREGAPMLTVVGVVEDVQEDRFNFGIDRPVWYLPYPQSPSPLPSVTLVLETSDRSPSLHAAVREAVWSVDPEQPIADVVAVDEHVETFLGPQRFSVLLMGAFAVLGLLLAAVGLYGLLSYWIARSRRETGVRMALGALPADLLRLTLMRGLRLTLAGLVIGTAAGWALSRLLAGTVEQLAGGGGPGLYAAIAAVLLPVALLAVYLPARRTARVDPVAALKFE